jgi:hypothetical protein
VLTVRPRPCSCCPYRRDVPSGIWAAEEYDALVRYDAPIDQQPASLFLCHQRDDHLCAGWAGCHDMWDTLAARIAAVQDRIDPAVFDYVSPVPLFGSGTEAAEHGKRDIAAPGPDAQRTMDQLHRLRARRTDW